MTRVLIIGKTGQVAQALALCGDENVVCLGRPDVDLLDARSLRRALDAQAPDVVINAGAYTAVDAAETEPEESRKLNVKGPGALAAICTENGVPFIHLSTECVFNGAKQSPYTPRDAAAPLGVYGQSKLEGELAVRKVAPRSLIVRVSWVFSQFGKNFVRTMLELAETRSSVTVVSDQTGCPTYAPALAAGLLEIARQVAAPGFSAWGTYHLAGGGETDRASMTRQIYVESLRYGGPSADVIPVLTADYQTRAQRPLNARLDMTDTTHVFGVVLPHWASGLEQTVSILAEELSWK